MDVIIIWGNGSSNIYKQPPEKKGNHKTKQNKKKSDFHGLFSGAEI